MPKPYKYITHTDKCRQLDGCIEIYYQGEYLSIVRGLAIIKKGYAWDGATPKIKIKNNIIGVPDGSNDQCKKATLWHDALYQYKPIGISRKYADDLFLKDLIEAKWKYAKLYYCVVRVVGFFTWNLRKTIKK